MPSIASSKVVMTTILSQRKAGPWKRDNEKTNSKEQTAFYNRFQPSAGPSNETAIDVMWLSPTETKDEEFGCFVAVGLGKVLKKGILFPLAGNEITSSGAGDSHTSDIVYISDSCYSRILNSINKRNPTAFAIAEVTESELEDDNLGLEQFLGSESDGDDGVHEANTFLYPPEGIADIRSRRERPVRKRNFDDMVYY